MLSCHHIDTKSNRLSLVVFIQEESTSSCCHVTISIQSRIDSDLLSSSYNKKQTQDDKEKRELIDTQNQAEQLIYQTEKNLEEYKDKLDDTEKKSLEDNVEKLKTAKDGENVENLKSALDELNNAWNQVASKMYDSAKEDSSDQGPSEDDSTKKSKKKKKDDAEIEDADFEVVD